MDRDRGFEPTANANANFLVSVLEVTNMSPFLLHEFKNPISLQPFLEAEPPPSSEALWQVCLCIVESRGRSEIQNKQKQTCFLEMRLRVRMRESVHPILPNRPGFPALPSITASGRLQTGSGLVTCVTCVLYVNPRPRIPSRSTSVGGVQRRGPTHLL